MRTYQITIAEREMEQAIKLPGYSHCSQPFTGHMLWYPFTEQHRRCYFQASSKVEAGRKVRKLFGTSNDRLSPVAREPEKPETYVRRKRELATRLCNEQTQNGDFSRLGFFRCVIGWAKE